MLNRKVYKVYTQVSIITIGAKMTLASKIERILEWASSQGAELPEEVNDIKKEAEETMELYRKKAVKKVIDLYRKDYPLLEKVIKGGTTFEKEYKPLIDKYSGIKSFFLPRWLTKEETKIPKENKGLIHDYNLSDRIRALEKPASWAATGIACAYLASLLVGITEVIIPPYASQIVYSIGAGFTFLIGIGFSNDTFKRKNTVKGNTKLLDEQIREIYKTS